MPEAPERTLGDFDALSFDCYGTLIDWEAGITAELASWAQRRGLAARPDELLAAFAAHETLVQQAASNSSGRAATPRRCAQDASPAVMPASQSINVP